VKVGDVFEINLLPGDHSRSGVALFDAVSGIMITLALFSMVLLWTGHHAKLKSQRAEIEKHQRETGSAPSSAFMEELDRQKSMAAEKQRYIDKVGQNRMKWSDMIGVVEKALPVGAVLTEIRVEDGNLRIKGRLPDYESLAQFGSDMNGKSNLAGVTYTFLQHDQGMVEFELQVKGREGN
jgi:Tfp pilus assembly protein PilN